MFLRTRLFLIFCAALAVVLLARPAISYTNYYLAPPDVGASVAPYTNWAMAASNLNDIIARSIHGDTIIVSNGTFSVTNYYTITKSVTITNFNSNLPIFDGGQRTYLFRLVSTGVVLDGLIISNGIGNTYGGGIWLQYGQLLNCIITHCRTTNLSSDSYGGGD
jgi:hypothetical protein